MDFIISRLIFGLFLILFFSSLLLFTGKKLNTREVKLTKIYSIMFGFLIISAGGLCLFIYLNSKGKGQEDIIYLLYFFIIIFLICIYGIIYTNLWKITYYDEYFIYRSGIGITYKIYYDQIISIKELDTKISFKTEVKNFDIDPYANGLNVFLNEAKRNRNRLNREKNKKNQQSC